MKISIVIPNYNGMTLLAKNLPEVIKTGSGAEIIIVDDASTDGSVLYIKNKILNEKNTNNKKYIKLIINPANLGFSSSVNRGVKEASGELVVLLNTDIIPQKGYLEHLIEHFWDQEVFAVGCIQKCPEGGRMVLRGRGIGKFGRGFLVHSRGEVNKHNTLWVSAGAGCFRKRIWEKLGGMCEFYNPFYWEDIDLSYRALKAGYKIKFESRSMVIHDQAKGAIRSKYSESEVKTIAYRNQILFVWMNLTDPGFIAEHCLFMLIHLIRSVIKKDDGFIKGFFLAVRGLIGIYQRRRQNRRLFVKSDREILDQFLV